MMARKIQIAVKYVLEGVGRAEKNLDLCLIEFPIDWTYSLGSKLDSFENKFFIFFFVPITRKRVQ